jgi:hypothetical protein
MTFTEILTMLETKGMLPASRVKDMKTSLRYLAQALGHTSPDVCQVGVGGLDPTTWTDALETHFQALAAQGRSISAATRRNTRNNLRVLFRLAEEHGALAEPMPPRLFRVSNLRALVRGAQSTAPYKATYRPETGPRRFGLRQAQWPADIAHGFQEYQSRCALRIRETTFRKYAVSLELYLGYIANICGRLPTWEDVFDVAQLAAYVRWHGARGGRTVSHHGWMTVCEFAAIAKVLKHPNSRALADFRNELKEPPPVHNKRHHWVSLKQLEEVAEACLAEGRQPFKWDGRTGNPGTFRAVYFQRGVILKLLVRVPLRQRNVRELHLEKNLYKDQAGHWQLHFSGDELKIGTRQGRPNTYHVDLTEYCPDFVPVLEEFLRDFRPRFPGAQTQSCLFLQKSGKPTSDLNIREGLLSVVSQRTGQRFYPHLVRSIWATEYLEKTQDFTTAATMLGDTLGVVMKTYYDVVHKDQHAKAKAFLGTALHTG